MQEAELGFYYFVEQQRRSWFIEQFFSWWMCWCLAVCLCNRADKVVYRASKWQHLYLWVNNTIQLMLPRITSWSLAPCCSITVQKHVELLWHWFSFGLLMTVNPPFVWFSAFLVPSRSFVHLWELDSIKKVSSFCTKIAMTNQFRGGDCWVQEAYGDCFESGPYFWQEWVMAECHPGYFSFHCAAFQGFIQRLVKGFHFSLNCISL